MLLTEYAAELDAASVPLNVLDAAQTVLADSCAAMLSGSSGQFVDVVQRTLAGDGPCTIVGHSARARPEYAALINGLSAHESCIDDSHAPSRTHPAAVIVPAALAAAEVADDASGQDLLAAIVVGYDVTARLSKAMGVRSMFRRGFHGGSVCGALGAAACVGRLLRLDETRMRVALALSASQSAGLLGYRNGSAHTLKSLQLGAAARNGVLSAVLSQSGFSGLSDVVIGAAPFLSSFDADVDVAQVDAELGVRFEITDTSIKRHACGGQTHSAVDAALYLRDNHSISPLEIEKIDIQLPHDCLEVVDGSPLLTHNVQYVVAVALHKGFVDVEHFRPDWVDAEVVRTLAAKVVTRGSDALQAEMPRRKGAVVTIDTTRGSFEERVPAPHGNPEDPWSLADLKAKVVAIAGNAVGSAEAESIWSICRSMAVAPSVAPLMALLDQGREAKHRFVD